MCAVEDPATKAQILEISELCKGFERGKPVLQDVSLDLAEGDFVSIIGPSGCGKSTLLRLVAGLSETTSGTIHFGESLPSREALAFIFQDATLLPWLNVRDNVGMPLRLSGVSTADRTKVVSSVLELVKLERVARHYPRQLSGGMKMRASLARGLITKPKLLLMDEPFGALDAITRNQLNSELLRIREENGFTALFVTHSVNEAVFLSNRIIVLAPNPGRIAATFEIPFAYPRKAALRTHPDFQELTGKILQCLTQTVSG
ncbi:MAG: ABC transporter ATP-binding protein [Verrucomicrobiota bacterium]